MKNLCLILAVGLVAGCADVPENDDLRVEAVDNENKSETDEDQDARISVLEAEVQQLNEDMDEAYAEIESLKAKLPITFTFDLDDVKEMELCNLDSTMLVQLGIPWPDDARGSVRLQENYWVTLGGTSTKTEQIPPGAEVFKVEHSPFYQGSTCAELQQLSSDGLFDVGMHNHRLFAMGGQLWYNPAEESTSAFHTDYLETMVPVTNEALKDTYRMDIRIELF